MMKYKISFEEAEKHLLNIELIIESPKTKTLRLNLPSWRPGRYEKQNFAKNIHPLQAVNSNNKALKTTKVSTNVWQIENDDSKFLSVTYKVYANETNAGTSCVTAKYFYLNFINFLLFTDTEQPIQVQLLNTQQLKIACGQESLVNTEGHLFNFKGFYELYDSPMILSETLKTYTFKIGKIPFSFCIQGINNYDITKLKKDFKAFGKAQIDLFGHFPEKNYFYILLMLDHAFYHGVEHRNSTMMVLGPPEKDNYNDLLGLASHELFHTWNVCKTRPKELCPYNYGKDSYFSTCFIAEGITTYYGDLLLYRSGVFNKKEYHKELEARYKHHFENADQASMSLLESSTDLWVDGYQKSIPNRKVSVYHKGAIAAQALDILLKQKGKSLDEVIVALNKKFPDPSKGYTLKDYIEICTGIYGESLNYYFETYIKTATPIYKDFSKLLALESLKMEYTREGLLKLAEI